MSFIIERKGTKFSAPEYVRSLDDEPGRYTPYRNRARRFLTMKDAAEAHMPRQERVCTL